MSSPAAARFEALYGIAFGPAEGITHVMAVADEGGAHRVIEVGEHAPRSETDFFALSASRARVEAVLISGAILRAEPTLTYALPPALAALRATHLGRPLQLLVLTRGALPDVHPIYEMDPAPIAITPPGTTRLPAGIERLGIATPSVRDTVQEIKARLSLRSLGVEAGPTVAVPLYEAPVLIDELLLSVFEGPLDEAARGGAFLSAAALGERMRPTAPAQRVTEPSGLWRFQRFVPAKADVQD